MIFQMKEKNTKKTNMPVINAIKTVCKIVGAVFVVFILALRVSSVGGTVSYFRDSEDSLNNYLKADLISFGISTETTQVDLSNESSFSIVMTPDSTSGPVQYFVSTKVITGDQLFCSKINAFGTWPFPINGKLFSTVTDISTTTGSWTITASVPEEDKIPGSSCVLEFSYLGWSANSELGRSFSDTRKVNIEFFIPNLVQRSSSVVSEALPLPESVQGLFEEVNQVVGDSNIDSNLDNASTTPETSQQDNTSKEQGEEKSAEPVTPPVSEGSDAQAPVPQPESNEVLDTSIQTEPQPEVQAESQVTEKTPESQ